MNITKNSFKDFYNENSEELMDDFCNEIMSEEFAKFVLESYIEKHEHLFNTQREH